MAELTQQAGLVPPEFVSHQGEVLVRFRPLRYAAPLRIGHDLSDLQRQLLEVLATLQSASLAELRRYISQDTPERTLQHNLDFLRQVGLIQLKGYGRGSRWVINNE